MTTKWQMKQPLPSPKNPWIGCPALSTSTNGESLLFDVRISLLVFFILIIAFMPKAHAAGPMCAVLFRGPVSTALVGLTEARGWELKWNPEDNSYAVVERATGHVVSHLAGQFTGEYMAELSRDGDRVTIGSNAYSENAKPLLKPPETTLTGGIRVIDVTTGKVIRKFDPGLIRAITADGKTLVRIDDGLSSISAADVDSGKTLWTRGNPLSLFGSITISPDGSRMLVAGYGSRSMYDLKTGDVLFKVPLGQVAHFNRTGSQFWSISGRNITVRESQHGEVVFETELPRNAYTLSMPLVKFSRDEKIVAIDFNSTKDNDRHTLILNRDTGKSIDVNLGTFSDYSPDGKYIAVGFDGEVAVYDTLKLERVFHFAPQMYQLDLIRRAFFKPDSKTLVIEREKSSLTNDITQKPETGH